MRKIVQNAFAGVIALSVLLGAAAALILWTDRLSDIASPFLRVVTAAAELAGGAPILLGALYVATQTAVRIFASSAEKAGAAPTRAE